MSWSYDVTLATVKDRVRFAIGDVDSQDPLLSDEEISAILTQYQGDELRCCAVLLQAIAARLARQADIAVGALRESLSQRSVRYSALADRYQVMIQESQIGAAVAVHGVSDQEMTAIRQYDDRPDSQFSLKHFDHQQAFGTNGGDDDRL